MHKYVNRIRPRHLLAAGLALACSSAFALDQGDWIVRAGVAHVSPNDDSGELSGVPGETVDVKSGTALGFNITYMLTQNWGVELLGATPFSHDIHGKGPVTGKIASIKHLPPTLTLQYQFAPQSNIRPYVGAGVNYTLFFDEETKGAVAGLTNSISLDNSWGLAAEAGIDVDINDSWFVNASLWYMDIDTTATLGGGLGQIDVDIDPWALFVGVGTRF